MDGVQTDRTRLVQHFGPDAEDVEHMAERYVDEEMPGAVQLAPLSDPRPRSAPPHSLVFACRQPTKQESSFKTSDTTGICSSCSCACSSSCTPIVQSCAHSTMHKVELQSFKLARLTRGFSPCSCPLSLLPVLTHCPHRYCATQILTHCP